MCVQSERVRLGYKMPQGLEVVMRKSTFAFVFWFKYVYVQVFGVVRGLHWVNRNIQFAKLSGQKSLRRAENSFHWKCNRGLNLTAWEGT